MRDGTHWANRFTGHASNVAWRVYSNSVEGRDEARFMRTNSYTSATMDAGVPPDLKNNWFLFRHGQSNFFVF